MFPTLNLLRGVPCPDHRPPTSTCTRQPCPFSHDVRPAASNSKNAPAPAASASSVNGTRMAHASSTGPVPVKSAMSNAASGPIAGPSRSPIASSSKIASNSAPLPVATTTTRPVVPASKSVLSGSAPIPRIVVKSAAKLHTPAPTRQKLLQALYDQFLVLYSGLSDPQSIASRDALAQELECYSSSAAGTYRNSIISVLARLKKRPIAQTPQDEAAVVGTMSQYDARKSEREKLAAGHGILSADKLERYLLSPDTMRQLEYFVEVPPEPGGSKPLAHGEMQPCNRCSAKFVVMATEIPGESTECAHHWGRLAVERVNGVKSRVYSCCRLAVGAQPCSKGPHIFSEKSASALHSRAAFVPTSQLSSPGAANPVFLPIAAVDCELIYTTAGLSLARVTVVAPSARQTSSTTLATDVILDEYVRPPNESRVLDLVTRFSGIAEDDIDPAKGKAKFDLVGVQEALGKAGITDRTIFVGHGLENDLKALRVVHPRCIDTAALFPHPRGLPFRLALRTLASTHLKKFVQNSDPTVGHSSAEDAAAALELVRFKMMQDDATGRGSYR